MQIFRSGSACWYYFLRWITTKSTHSWMIDLLLSCDVFTTRARNRIFFTTSLILCGYNMRAPIVLCISFIYFLQFRSLTDKSIRFKKMWGEVVGNKSFFWCSSRVDMNDAKASLSDRRSVYGRTVCWLWVVNSSLPFLVMFSFPHRFLSLQCLNRFIQLHVWMSKILYICYVICYKYQFVSLDWPKALPEARVDCFHAFKHKRCTSFVQGAGRAPAATVFWGHVQKVLTASAWTIVAFRFSHHILTKSRNV